MDYLPVCLNLTGQRVLMIGGGTIATRKARLFSRAGAVIDVLSPEIQDELLDITAEGGQWFEEEWSARELSVYVAVVAATENSAVNAEISAQCKAQRIPVNVVDSPELCTFILPAIIDRNPLLIGISSSGASPVLARRVRSTIESLFPASYGRLANRLRSLRETVASTIAEESKRRYFWEALIDSEWSNLVLNGKDEKAALLFEQQLADQGQATVGAVYLIGAGPGDPELMTFKALRLLQAADVILYDRLIGPGILEMARRDAERIYVGKERSAHSMPQSDINQALLDFARDGKRVARLKGGDPFIFGRGGEEIEGLLEAEIPFEVVPGITAASGAACYAGIPLTHRDHAQSVRFITGHTKNYQLDLAWHQFLNERETLVFYMGMSGLAIISKELIAAGRDSNTPVAIVEKATRDDQRVILGTLGTIVEVAEHEKPQAPSLLIIGSVVSLHPQLGWFEGRAE